MPTVKHRPAPPLDKLVECFWWSQRDTPTDAAEHMLPTGCVYLVFPLHQLPLTCSTGSPSNGVVQWKRGIAHGPQSRFYVSGAKPAGAVVGVAFAPAERAQSLACRRRNLPGSM